MLKKGFEIRTKTIGTNTNPFPKDKIVDMSELKGFADDKNQRDSNFTNSLL